MGVKEQSPPIAPLPTFFLESKKKKKDSVLLAVVSVLPFLPQESGPTSPALKSSHRRPSVPIPDFPVVQPPALTICLARSLSLSVGSSSDLQAAVGASGRNVCLRLILIGSCVYTCSLV